MDESHVILLDLLKAAIWNRPADTTHWQKPVDWDGVYELAKVQALRGVIIDALLDLPEAWLPEKSWYENRLLRLMQIAQENAQHRAIGEELLQRLEDKNIHAMLMKGTTMAALYPHPQYRTCGDIDLYIGPEHYSHAIDLVCQWAETLHKDVVKDNGNEAKN
ncbi:MAG: nucleotidyltransferase family protein, partial [Bacteroidaceae bacterium]|nr:nucleotidyltransferase family protein [Bacteroidaceae bacterium]